MGCVPKRWVLGCLKDQHSHNQEELLLLILASLLILGPHFMWHLKSLKRLHGFLEEPPLLWVTGSCADHGQCLSQVRH